jgi:hypothetical protein
MIFVECLVVERPSMKHNVIFSLVCVCVMICRPVPGFLAFGSVMADVIRAYPPCRPLIWVECLVERPSRSRTDYVVKARSQFKERSVATNVEIILPLPSDATTPVTRCSQVRGSAAACLTQCCCLRAEHCMFAKCHLHGCCGCQSVGVCSCSWC